MKKSFLYKITITKALLLCGGFFIQCASNAPLINLATQSSWKMKVRKGSLLRLEGKISKANMNNNHKILSLSMKMQQDSNFKLVIFRADIHRFKNILPKLYGNIIIAEGRISTYKNHAQMIISSPDQLIIKKNDVQRLKLTKTDLKNKKNKIVSLSGTIAYASTSSSQKVAFLNFKRDLKKRLTLVIFADTISSFEASGISDPLEHFYKKRVTIKGRLKKYRGRYTIVIESAQQIQTI